MTMKKFLAFLIMFFGMFLTAFNQTYEITGTVYYANSNSDPMDHTYVYLWLDGAIIDSVETDGNGDYAFTDLSADEYEVSFAHTIIPFGGITTTDATMIQQHFVGQITLTGIYFYAAEVTGDDVINSADALEVCKRVNKMITEYEGGKDWVDGDDNKKDAEITTQSIVVDIDVVCFGDVDGSYSW